MRTCAIVLSLALCAGAITRDQFYPHGQGLDQRLPRGQDVPSPEIPLKVPIKFYGETYESIFVNNYGVLSFRADIPSFLNSEFPLPYPSIAAFYTNIDTTQFGNVYYRETDEPHVLIKAEESVQNNFHEYYDFKPTSVFIATWLEVTYAERPDRKNSFQIAIISNATETFVELLYPEREIQWIQREIQQSTLPDAKAQAGFVAEDGRVYTLRGSGSHQIRNIISWSNTQEPGKYVFRVGNILPDGNIAVPDQYDQYEVEVAEESKTCAQSGPSVCHIQARCVDYQAGICCVCNDGFYGNGKSCIKDDVPLRAHGRLNGIINDVSLNDVDIQAYIVVDDGRSYTALSQGPAALGSSLQLLSVLGGVVGWLFAKPLGEAKNGYQITGALFNHTADIYFPATGDRVTVNQEYLGHDVFDQIILETDIRGSIPVILTGTKLEISEYEEQYTVVESGLIRSESIRIFTNKITGEKYEQRVSQTFTYNPCRFAPPSEEDAIPSTLKVTKNYLGYETKNNIVRYGMSNKIVPLGQEDPCIRGKSTCGPHSTCIANGDSFSCVCQSGFTNIYLEGSVVCIDVDECTAGTHNCDSNADCYNHDGGFQCRCRAGFEGSGVSCSRISPCRRPCDANAQCVENNGAEATCLCNPGFTGDGISCYPYTYNPCQNCSSYAYCVFDRELNKQKCQCHIGYIGDGYQCVEGAFVQTTAPPPQTYNPCQSCSPYAYCVFDRELNKQKCQCHIGYIGDGYQCVEGAFEQTTAPPPQTYNPCQSCSPYAYCVFDRELNRQKCQCHIGYIGDGYQCVEGAYLQSTSPPPSQNTDWVPWSTSTTPSSAHQNPADYQPYPPNYQPSPPDYQPTPPDYQPNNSDYQPNNPDYQPNNPDYPPNNSDYQPNNSDYQPNNPDYQPNNPEPSPAYPPSPLYTTPSPPSTNEADYNETFVLPNCDDYECTCPVGYTSYKDERDNDLCRIDNYRPPANFPENDTAIKCDTDSDCPPNAICSYSPSDPFGVGQCMCPEGYEGDAYECIERTGSTCSCGLNAHCIDTANGEMLCVCDAGYHGDGYLCRPNFSCTNNSDCEYHAECRPDPASSEYVCQCIEGYIKDQNDACIPDGQLCNGAVCAEHASCLYDDTIGVSYCYCDAGYEGEGISQCVPQGTTCDVRNDCHPNAVCTPTETTYQCVCSDGFVGDGYSCTPEATCKNDPYMCDTHASCLKQHDNYVCECNTGYNGNGSYCQLNPRQAGNFLVATDGATVYKVPLKMGPRDFTMPINSASQVAVGVDVDCVSGRIYWGDVVGNSIKRVAYDGSGFELFLANDVKAPEGIAIDWAARNIFWTDSKKLTIEVANLDTKIRKVLFVNSGISNPRGIAVHPRRGKIFWSDWNRSAPKIEWANMDGTQRGVFLDQSDVRLPNSLAIDWSRDRLCYADAGLFAIKCVSIDSLERETIAERCSYPFGLTVSGDKFYWTDWKTYKIEFIDAQTHVKGQVPMVTAGRLYGVKAAPDQCPAMDNVCQYRNGNCKTDELCLPDGRGGRTCTGGDSSYDSNLIE